MPSKADTAVARTIGIDTGKNTLHIIGLDERGAIVLREKISRARIAARFMNLPPSDGMVETPPDETSSTSLSLSPSSKPENASEATSVGLPARYIQNEPPS